MIFFFGGGGGGGGGGGVGLKCRALSSMQNETVTITSPHLHEKINVHHRCLVCSCDVPDSRVPFLSDGTGVTEIDLLGGKGSWGPHLKFLTFPQQDAQSRNMRTMKPAKIHFIFSPCGPNQHIDSACFSGCVHYT